MIDWYKKVVLENYANFEGRARRSEYWWFIVGQIILVVIAMILDNLLGITFGKIGYGPIYLVFALATFIPGLAVAVRRLHDVGKSGWFYLIVFIPLIGAIWLIILFATEGAKGQNQYGMDPKGNNDDINSIGNPQ